MPMSTNDTSRSSFLLRPKQCDSDDVDVLQPPVSKPAVIYGSSVCRIYT